MPHVSGKKLRSLPSLERCTEGFQGVLEHSLPSFGHTLAALFYYEPLS